MLKNDDSGPLLPVFEAAVSSLRDFLEREGLNSEILWIFREDVSVKHGGRPGIRWPVPADNCERSRVLYEQARASGFDVEIMVYCCLKGAQCCFVSVLRDKKEAESRMVYGLKLFLPETLREARPLTKSWYRRFWHFLSGGEWPDWILEDAPMRSAEV